MKSARAEEAEILKDHNIKTKDPEEIIPVGCCAGSRACVLQ